MSKNKALIYLFLAAAILLAAEGAGIYFHLAHHQLFFGEMALIALSVSLVLLALGWCVRKLLAREDGYYKHVRERTPLIETRQQDWVE